jgi:hypothetical protein
MAKVDKGTLAEAVGKEIKSGFSLNKFKEKKALVGNVKFKEERWIPFSSALQDVVSVQGIPMGHISMVRGRSNSGKTTTSIELAISAQKMGILPVIIMTEMKHSWDHWKTMGFQMDDVLDDKGNIVDHDGFFIYVDRSTLNSIEDVAKFIVDLLGEQSKGNLPHDLLFIWDSVGSIPCDMSIEKGANSPMWNAGAVATQFGNFINQQIVLSRKSTSKYTNTLFIVNKVGIAPAMNVMSQPKMTNKNGDTFYWDASLCFTFGNITNSGTSKIFATKDKKKVEFAIRTKIACDKNHVSGVATTGTVISTVHGFIADDPKMIAKYKKEHSEEWTSILGQGDFDLFTDDSEWFETTTVTELLDEE